MQDAQVKTWTREPLVPPALLHSVRELNQRFLELVGMPPDDWSASARAGLSADVSGQVAPLSAEQKKAAADCPYALFDLRFHDDAHWQLQLLSADLWCVADEASCDDQTLDFVRLALFFAWHVASQDALAARFLLGMSEATAAAFRGISIHRLPALAVREAAHLAARWSNCPAFWRALTEAASRRNSSGLRRIQLYGLQLAAAARLP